MTERIRLFKVQMPSDLSSVLDTLHSGLVAEGPRVAEFEERIASFVGNPLTVALNSGTSSLHLALVAAGVKQNSLVISTPITSPATNVSIVNLGARILWADVDSGTGNISPDSVKRLMGLYGDEVTAVMAVHWGGYPCDMNAISQAVAGKAYVIEDAAHALSATYKDRTVGAISDLTCFSFQAIKHITTGDGGLLCCLNEEDYQRTRNLRWFGVDRSVSGRSWSDDFIESGYKFHMNDIAATIGLKQLEDLPNTVARRRQIAAIYENEFADLSFQRSGYECRSSYWLFTMMVERREEFIRALDSADIDCSPVHRRNDTYTAFADATAGSDDLENVGTFGDQMVCIPVGQWLTDDDVNRVVTTINKGW